ncbi:MAG: MmgE/PrpD family protein [Rhodospirillaceae bacterium]|jgi:2-methylcitrate dehydratase|nr:MmgE/PrpD family protein [Rhodospirillaceae bacterium]MBT5457722.1 MmgE/PrpD family protein [Rhodospirillaceae bacterium]
MDRLTGQIATFANALTFDDLGDDIVHVATQRAIDALGCALGANDCKPAEIGRRLAAGQTPGKFAGRTLFADHRLPLEIAAFINSCMIRNFDFNDRFPGGHPSDGMGAHLAYAGANGITGKQYLAAMVVTYEIFIRLSESSKMRTLGWDQGFAVGVSTTAGLGNLLGLSVEQIANAIGMTATASVPLRVTRSGELTPWKNVATPYAARNGVFSALLAAEGMEGPGNAFEGRKGLFENITGPFDIAPFATEGGDFRIPRVLLKYWPLETNGQPAVWAALELREKVQPGDIESLDIRCDEFTRFEIGSEPEKWDPQTRETADHSLPYIFARALVDGPINVDSFDEAMVRDPALRPLLNKITVTTDPDIEAMLPKMIIRAIARTKDGATHEVEVINPLGHPDNPMQDSHIEAKFRAQAEPVLGAERCSAALKAWWRLGEASDLRPLIGLLDI